MRSVGEDAGRGNPRFGADGTFSEQCHIPEGTKGEWPVPLGEPRGFGGSFIPRALSQHYPFHKNEKQEVRLQQGEELQIPREALGSCCGACRQSWGAAGTGRAGECSMCDPKVCKGVARGGTAWHGLLGSWSKPLPVTAAGGRDQAGGDQGRWVLPFLLFPWLQGPHSGNSRFDVSTPAASPSLDPGEAVEELPPPGAQGSFAVSS